MPRIYLLVQNDVRTGPFTLEELLKQSLHANAMVWIIGQSEDWLSPIDIPALQSYFVQHSDGSLSVKDTVLEDIRSNHFTEPLEFLSTDSQRVGALDTQLLEQPTNTGFASMGSTVKEKTTFEPHVVSLAGERSKESVSTSRKREKANEPVTEKEDDNSTIARKNWAVIGVVLLLIVFITWNALFNDGPRIKRNKEYAASAPVLQTEQPSSANANPLKENTSVEEFSESAPLVEEGASIVVVPDYTNQQLSTASTDAFLDSVQRVLDSQDQLMANVDDIYRKSFHYRKRYNKPVLANRRIPATASKSVQKQPVITKSTGSNTVKVPLSQQVDLQSRLIMDRNRQQLNSVEVVVKNNSKELLKTVSVDVYYYKKGEKLLNKETVYFSNLYPKQSITKSIAGNQRATSARFQLGIVSAN